jgi:uncharacterized protein (TIGR03382 family)
MAAADRRGCVSDGDVPGVLLLAGLLAVSRRRRR